MSKPVMELRPSVMRSFFMKKMALEQKETGGDDFIFWREANAIRSAHRIDALNSEFCTFRSECGKFAVEQCIKNGFTPEDKKTHAAFLSELGLFTEECEVLVEEYVKSAAELCIKKMRLGALVDKCDKQTTLVTEVATARKQWKEIWYRFAAFRDSLSATRKHLQQDSLIEDLECGLSDVMLGSGWSVKVIGIRRERFRVLVEMMRGVNRSGQIVNKSGLDNAMALGKQWTDAVVGLCLTKLWVGTFVERLSVYEVLKREIAENWKMEKELKDRIAAYQSEHARLAQGSVTKVDPQPQPQPQPRVEGDDTIKAEGETSGVGAVVDGDEAMKEKKSGMGTVLEGEETVEVKKSEGSSVLEGEETVQEKKNGGVALGEGARGLTKHHVVEVDEAIKEKNETLNNKRRRTSG